MFIKEMMMMMMMMTTMMMNIGRTPDVPYTWSGGCLFQTRSSAITERPRDASCQLKSCQLPRSSAETTYTTSPDQTDGMKLEI